MRGLARFLKYNNIVPVTLSLLLLSFGSALAASPEVREDVTGSVYSEKKSVLSVDNTYIASKDLSSYTPRVEILGVTEDTDSYYVAYRLLTIDVQDYVWQDVAQDDVMTVAKSAIEGRDLGVYVTEQLKQIIDRQVAYLKEVQEIERQSITQKVVATAYAGLVGKLLDDTTEVLPGYVPVVKEKIGQESSQESGVSSEQSGQVAGVSTENTGTGAPSTPQPSSGSVSVGGDASDQTPPTLQILGNNPARIMQGNTYSDLGVVVTDNVNRDLGAQYYVNGKHVLEVQINTQEPGEWVIRYEATDQAGNKGYAERVVIVYEIPAGTPRPQTGTPAPTPADASSTPTAPSGETAPDPDTTPSAATTTP